MRGGTTKAAFHEAQGHERELNDRQREVLALVAQGLTNAEIGKRLGMSLDGAKWNVSEILSKLGLASREEAAEYWRWRHGGVWSRVRALFGAPLAKVAVGAGAAAVVGVVVVAALLSEDEPPTEDLPGRPFYMEAEFHVTSTARSIGTNLDAGGNEVDESSGVIRWWWQDADHFRVEYDLKDPDTEAGTRLMVGDGETEWTYLEADGVYSKRPLTPVPKGYRVRPITMSLLIGALPLADNVDTVNEFIQTLTGWQADGQGWAKVVGEETYLGRHVTVVEMGPVGCSYSEARDSTDATVPKEECSGTSRLWLDVERMLVLRHTAEGDVQSFEARVTKLDYDVEHRKDIFRFQPPPGAREDEADGDNGAAAIGPIPRAGFFALATPPAGYRWTGTGGTDGGTPTFSMSLEGPDGAELRVMQTQAPLPKDLRDGDQYTVHGMAAYGLRNPDGRSQLAWEEAGVAVVIEADRLSVAELVAMAESMRLVE